jgi:hypothetical protein
MPHVIGLDEAGGGADGTFARHRGLAPGGTVDVDIVDVGSRPHVREKTLPRRRAGGIPGMAHRVREGVAEPTGAGEGSIPRRSLR